MDVSFKNDIEPTISNYDKYKEQGDIILSVAPVNFETEDGKQEFPPMDGGHAVSVTGKTVDGRLIVSSWGRCTMLIQKTIKNQAEIVNQISLKIEGALRKSITTEIVIFDQEWNGRVRSKE